MSTTNANNFVPPPPPPGKTQMHILAAMDKNKDGKVDAEELIRGLDTNHDNVLDVNEVRKLGATDVPIHFKTREHGYGINPYLYLVFRFTAAFQRPLYLLFCILIFLQNDSFHVKDQYYLNEVFMDKFIGATFNDVDGFELTFTDITSTDNIWRYLDQVFLPAVSPATMTQPMLKAYRENILNDGTKPLTMDGLLLILYPPTLRQVRSESPYLDASFTSTSTDAWLLEDQLGNNTCSYDKAFNTMDYTPCTVCTPYVYTGKESKKVMTASCGCNESRAYHSKVVVSEGDPDWSGHYGK